MKGNDIVDLKQAAQDSDWTREGYLQKIYTKEEQEFIGNAYAPDTLVWLLWSMKEAAYKIFSKKNDLRNYAPARIVCTVEPPKVNFVLSWPTSMTVYGKAEHEGMVYFTKSFLNYPEQYIHTLACSDAEDLERTEVRIQEYDSEFDYQRLHPDSVSHHGRYLAMLFSSQQ